MAVTDKLFLVPAAKCACRHLLGAIKFDFAHVCIMNLPEGSRKAVSKREIHEGGGSGCTSRRRWLEKGESCVRQKIAEKGFVYSIF